MKMRYLKNHEIDKEKYDLCIDSSPNPKVYAYSWYLDAMCEHKWDAIISEDYSIVFPLPFAYKFGFLRYINPPPFVQQLGIFGREVDDNSINHCLKTLPLNFMVLRQYFNATNNIVNPSKVLVNYQLKLDSYDRIQTEYNKDLKNNLRKISFEQVTINPFADIDLTIQLFKENYPTINDNRYDLFKQAALESIQRGNGINFSFHLDEKPLAYAFFLKNHHYIHYMMPGPTKLGRQHSIIQGVLDFIIREHCGKNLTMDFEGSQYPNVAALYKKYGSYKEEYYLKNIWAPTVLMFKYF